MIDYGSSGDVQQVYDIWKKVFAFDDGGFTDYFFKHGFDIKTTLCLKEDNIIKSIGSYSSHNYMLNNRIVKASLIYGVATLEEYRHQGYMKQIMKAMLEVLGHRELVTFIQAYSPNLYTPYGFETIYYRKSYELLKSNTTSYSTNGCTKSFSGEELLRVYAKFASKFNGYMIRDEAYFNNYRQEVEAQNGYIIGVRDKNHQLKGYACIYDKKDHIEIEELVYLDIQSVLKIVSLALKLKDKVIMHSSSNEHLEKLFKSSKVETYDYTMAKINNYSLFNRLYECNVNSISEAFKLVNKPLMMIENH